MAFLFQYRSGSGGGVTDNIYTADGTIVDALRTVSIPASGILDFTFNSGGFFELYSDGMSEEFYQTTDNFGASSNYAYSDIYASTTGSYANIAGNNADRQCQVIVDSTGGTRIEASDSAAAASAMILQDFAGVTEIRTGVPVVDFRFIMGSAYASGDRGGYWGIFPNWPDINRDGTEYGFYFSPVYWGGSGIVTELSEASVYNNNIFLGVYNSAAPTLVGSQSIYESLIETRLDYLPDNAYASIRSDIGPAYCQIQLRASRVLPAAEDAYINIGQNVIQINAQGYSELLSGNTALVRADQINGRVYISAMLVGVDQSSIILSNDGNAVINGNNVGGDLAQLGFENIAINANDAVDVQAITNINLGCASLTFGLSSSDVVQFQAEKILFDGGSVFIMAGNGTPEGVVTANVGSLFLRQNGGAGTTLYVKESGVGNTGWVAK